jgi:hypothetical protein
VFLLGFHTLSAKIARCGELALHERSALWQHEEREGCATGAERTAETFF